MSLRILWILVVVQIGFMGRAFADQITESSGGSDMSSPDLSNGHGGPGGGHGPGGGGHGPGGGGHGPGGWPPPPPPPPPSYGRACFYQDVNYGGASFCLDEGQQEVNLAQYPGWNDIISSIWMDNGISVTICINANFNGCTDIVGNYPNLGNVWGANWNDTISSMRVNRGPGGR